MGCLAQLALVATLADWLGSELPSPSLAPVAAGIATGMVALLGFALPPLIQIAQVPPLRALRRDLGPPRASAALAVLSAAWPWPSWSSGRPATRSWPGSSSPGWPRPSRP